jgi:signal transduction histidine kinase
VKDNINQMIRNLVHSQKIEAVGQLTDLLSRRLGGNDQLRPHLSATRHAAERGQSVTQQLLAFSRRQHLQPQTLDVSALVQQFEPLIRRAVGERNAGRLACTSS